MYEIMVERIKTQSFPSSQSLEMMIILYQRRPKPKAKAKISPLGDLTGL